MTPPTQAAPDTRQAVRRNLRELATTLRRFATDLDTITRADYQTPAGFALATRAAFRLYSRSLQQRIDQITADAGIDLTRET